MYAVVKTTSCKRPFNLCILGGRGLTVHVYNLSYHLAIIICKYSYNCTLLFHMVSLQLQTLIEILLTWLQCDHEGQMSTKLQSVELIRTTGDKTRFARCHGLNKCQVKSVR